MTAYLLHCVLLTSNFRVPLFYDIHVVKVHITSYFVLIFFCLKNVARVSDTFHTTAREFGV